MEFQVMANTTNNSGWLVTKTRRIMRLSRFTLIAACLLVSARAVSQTVTLSEKQAPLQKVFREIYRQTGFQFFYKDELMNQAGKIDIEVKNEQLEKVLEQCFRHLPFTYTIVGKTIVVKSKVQGAAADTARPPREVRGLVRNEKGEPAAGISVLIKGTKRGTVTDENGTFTLTNVERDDVLEFTSVGTEPVEQVVGERTQISILIKTKVNEIANIVVSTGYQNLKRMTVAGSVSSISASDLYFSGTNTLEQALQGKLPGVVVINNDGLVGTRQKTIVRGVSTLTGTQDPIWVVDGVIQSDPLPFKAATLNSIGQITPDNFDYVRNFVGSAIAWLNPNDIEDITVLKDASATAIYGVRAANGVIVINTKKGKEGPPTISYSNTVNIAEKVSYDRLGLMNSKDRVAVSKEIWQRGLTSAVTVNNIGFAGALNDYLFGRITYDQFNAEVRQLETANVNWFDILFRNPVSVNQSLSLSGGNANTRYYSSFGYVDTKGTAIGNDEKNYTANIGLNFKVNNKLTASVQLAASEAETNGFYKVDPYTYASTTSRIFSAYDSTGALFYYKNRQGYLFNIQNELANSTSTNKNFSANTNLNINYEIARGWRFSSLFSASRSNVTGHSSASERTAYIAAMRGYDFGTANPTDAAYINSPMPRGGEYNEADMQNTTWNWRNSLSYSHVFNLVHTVSVMLGQEANSSHYQGLSSTSYGYMPDRGNTFTALPLTYTSYSIPNPYLITPKTITDRTTNNMGLYGTLNYSYDNRYVLNFSVRSDASNRFGQYTGEKFNPVYAGGVRWNMMYEKWAQNWSWLSTLSLRSSFGYQRNIVTTVSPDLIALIPTTSNTSAAQVIDLFTGEDRLLVASLPYGNLRWEKTATVNTGVDFGFFKNRITGTVEYYVKKASDLITTLPVPIEYGVASMPVNGGDLTNRGLEVVLNLVPIQTKDVTLSIGFNTSKNYSDLDKAGIQNPTWRVAAAGGLYENGYPVTGIWAFDFTGIDPTNGHPTFNLATAKGKDPTTDPTAYMKYMGKLDPDLTGGLNFNFRYKMFSLGSTFYLQLGGKRFLTPAYPLVTSASVGLPTEYENLSTELLNRWTPTNTKASLPGLPTPDVTYFLLPDGKTYSNVYEMYNYSSARVVNASTLQLNSINLMYTFPQHISNLMRAKLLSASLGASNVFSWVSKEYKGRDAEVATGSQPRTRSYSLRLNVSF